MRTAGVLQTIIEVIFDVIAVLLAARILLRFFGASSDNFIINWLYETTGQLVAPFAGIFPNPRIDGTFVVDIAAVIALIVYSIVGVLLLSLLSDIRRRAEANEHYEDVEHKRRRR